MADRGLTTRSLVLTTASIASGLVTLAASAVGVLSGYLAVITARAAAGRFPRPGEAPRPAPSMRRFAIMVPAHNEVSVIGRALESFVRLDYPRDQFNVHVVADNCTDGTAAVVRRCGFDVHERSDLAAPGKGPALNWLFRRLVADSAPFDAVVIVDADTTVHPDFLSHIAAALDDGAVAAQAYYGVRDAGESTAAAMRYAALACRHHVRPLGRAALGGSSGLYGNGMAFDVDLMRDRAWSGHLTEDMEFQMDLLLDGHRVVYVPGAVLEAEMPHNLDGATSQNERWELGRIQMAKRYVPTLAWRMVNNRKLRVAHADAVLDHLVPPLSVLVAANAACGAGALVMTLLRGRRIDRVNLLINIVSATVVAAHVFYGLRSVRAPASVYRSLRHAPRIVVWKIGLWFRVLLKPNDVIWTRTTRNSEPR